MEISDLNVWHREGLVKPPLPGAHIKIDLLATDEMLAQRDKPCDCGQHGDHDNCPLD